MTWVGGDPGFGLDHLPYGVFSTRDSGARVGVAIGDQVLDAGAVAAGMEWTEALRQPTLDAFLALGPGAWRSHRGWLQEHLGDEIHGAHLRRHLHPRDDVVLHLPFTVADYVDFYASRHHAENVGRMFRPGEDPLPKAWRHLPMGYHGRGGTVVASGSPIRRPRGQVPGSDGLPALQPTRRLDLEAEVGFVVGVGSGLGEPVDVEAFAAHVFGVVLLNDWSARDVQAWEYRPLGPFLGKSFATSIAAWVTPLAALAPARVNPPVHDPPELGYLRGLEHWGLELELEVVLNGTVVSRPPFATMYWTADAMLAHLTVNGARVRTGDLYASGTVSGPERQEWGSLLELSWDGAQPVRLDDGTRRAFLEDGDTVTIRGSAPAPGGGRLTLGEVSGTVEPALLPDPRAARRRYGSSDVSQRPR